MPTQVDIQPDSTASPDIDVTRDLTNIGIELEYPRYDPDEASYPAPVAAAEYSGDLREEAQSRDFGWLDMSEEYEPPGGYMGRDHTGAEITSPPLPLHSDLPERWYRASINAAEAMGHQYAATGDGATNFGNHLHLSSVSTELREAITEMCQEPWARLFWCSSIHRDSADPWRHGGIAEASLTGRPNHDGFRNETPIPQRESHNDHYEFRLPEPVLPETFSLWMDFFREAEYRGPDAAVDFARAAVFNAEERLTSVQQYRWLENNVDRWPDQRALSNDNVTSRRVAERVVEIMENA